MEERKELKRKINLLVNFLPQYYSDLELENHCYRRIAYDMTVKNKWQKKVKAPFVENAEIFELKLVVANLESFVRSKHYMQHFNRESLKYRKNGK